MIEQVYLTKCPLFVDTSFNNNNNKDNDDDYDNNNKTFMFICAFICVVFFKLTIMFSSDVTLLYDFSSASMESCTLSQNSERKILCKLTQYNVCRSCLYYYSRGSPEYSNVVHAHNQGSPGLRFH